MKSEVFTAVKIKILVFQVLGTYSASYPMGTGDNFPVGKAAGA
jgi:hypothetical protein